MIIFGLIKGTSLLPEDFFRKKTMTTLAERFNMYKRSKRKIYEDNRLVYKLTLFIKFHLFRKILHIFKLGWVNLQEHPFSGFSIFLILFILIPFTFALEFKIIYIFLYTYINCNPYFQFFNLKLNVWSHLMRRRV